MYAPTENITNFTGVLVQRQYKPGQKYIQLVFQTAEGFRLSLSRNLQMVRSLNTGHTYQVKGPEYLLGEKTYIHEPTAVLVQTEKGLYKRHIRLFIVGAVLILISGIASAVFYETHSTANAKQSDANNINIAKELLPEISSAADTISKQTSQAQPAATPPVTTATTQSAKASKATAPVKASKSDSNTAPTTQAPVDTTPAQDTPAPVPPVVDPIVPPVVDPIVPPIVPPVVDPIVPPVVDPVVPVPTP